MSPDLAGLLICPSCQASLHNEGLPRGQDGADGVLRCACGRDYPVVAGVPRILPDDLASALLRAHPGFFTRNPDLAPAKLVERRIASEKTMAAFGDEWRRFPERHAEHEHIFDWYFEGPEPVRWKGLRVLDAGCGMGRWLHFARRKGAHVVGMDVSPAIDVAAGREGGDLVQADLRWPPFPRASFDLIYSLGVLHHLEDPVPGLQSLASLLRPGGELRIYVYRSLAGDPWARRALLALVTALRRLTTGLPYPLVHAVAVALAVVAQLLFIWPRRLLRRSSWGDRLTRGLPLVQYADVPFRMLVAEQFDRLVAPIEGRYTEKQVRGWFDEIGFELVALLPGLGWRAIGRLPKPSA